MNYVWAQREMEEHREESETIAVPFLDLKEKEEREREVLKREIKSFGRRRKRQKRNGLLRKYPYSINAAHSVLRCSHFRFTASTFWQKKAPFSTWRISCTMSPLFSLSASVCIHRADGSGSFQKPCRQDFSSGFDG